MSDSSYREALLKGNVGSVLKTIDEEVSEEGGRLPHRAQECSSDSASATAGERSSSSKRSASTGRATDISTDGRQTSATVREEAHEAEERQEEGESGTVVGFLTLLSFQQYPEVVAPFRKAILKLGNEHASADQKRILEQIFLTSMADSENRAVNSSCRTGRANKTSTSRSNPAAEVIESGDEVVNCGWLLKERLSNTPPQLIPQMYDSLLEDISWSLSTEEMDEDERPFYAYSYVCGLTKVYKAGDGGSYWSTSKRHRTLEALPFDAIFPHPEDELLAGLSSVTFAWPTGKSVRISLENEGVEASSVSATWGSQRTSPPTRIRCCPEYLLFFALPFEQFRHCKDAIAARAREVA